MTTTVVGEDGSVTTTTTTTEVDPETGATTVTSNSHTTQEDGYVSTTNSETTTNTDGSYTSNSSTTNQDGSSSTVNSVGNADGSSETHGMNYDSNGDPTDGYNNEIDTSGNSSTQDVEYINGDPVVTGYNIDTSSNPDGEKEITGTGVDTEFLPFNGSGGAGFTLHIAFHTVKTEQPNPPLVVDTEDTGANYLFNIMTAKSPFQPWRGFHIRWALKKTDYTSGNIEFGYTAAGASSTTRSNITQQSNGNYDITVIYDPNKTTINKKLRVIDNRRSVTMVDKDITFETNDLDFLLGYALSQAGTGYRYSNVQILDFSITKL